MYLVYTFIYSIGFLLMLPAFLLNRQKYASGFSQRLGNYSEFKHDGRKVIWLHCVSVGETNAARPLVDKLVENFPDHCLVVSTITKTGQELAQKIFAGKADAVIYFPFDWKFTVRRALDHFKPSLVLLMETEIWPRFIHEAKMSGAKVAIVNGRLSAKSANRYAKVRAFISGVLSDVDLALMQTEGDMQRITALGMAQHRTHVTGNMKFDLELSSEVENASSELDSRFALTNERPLIVAASTHEREEKWVLEAFCSIAAGDARRRPRLMIVPRHPERFDAVAKMINEFRNDAVCEWTRYTLARRSADAIDDDTTADVILLDSIGELRAVYRFAEVVFVGGSLIPHGGQSILEPAAAGKAIVTGPFVHNFEDVVRVFKGNNALVQLGEMRDENVADELFLTFSDLLENETQRRELGRNALAVMSANRGATTKTVKDLLSFGNN